MILDERNGCFTVVPMSLIPALPFIVWLKLQNQMLLRHTSICVIYTMLPYHENRNGLRELLPYNLSMDMIREFFLKIWLNSYRDLDHRDWGVSLTLTELRTLSDMFAYFPFFLRNFSTNALNSFFETMSVSKVFVSVGE